MYWIRNSTGSVIHNTYNSRNQSMIVIKVNSRDNGEMFTFKATFRQENNSYETVVTWNFTVKVLYAPRNLVIKPDGGVYEVGDRLECWADGNPTPNYEWMDTETRRIITGSVLVLEEDLKPGQDHTFRCTAYNTVAGLRDDVHSDHVTFRVAGTATTQSGSFLALTGSVVTVTLLCIVIVIIVFVSRRVNTSVKSKRPEEVLAERQDQSDLNCELREEKTISKKDSQHRWATDQGLANEVTYANLMHKSFDDQQYSRLHIYSNSSVNTTANANASANAEYANMPLN